MTQATPAKISVSAPSPIPNLSNKTALHRNGDAELHPAGKIAILEPLTQPAPGEAKQKAYSEQPTPRSQ